MMASEKGAPLGRTTRPLMLPEPDSLDVDGCVGLTDGTPICAFAITANRQNVAVKTRTHRMLSNDSHFIKGN